MKLPRPLENAYTIVEQTLRKYSADNGGLVAAAISFYVFLTFVPLLVLAVVVLGYLIGSPSNARDFVVTHAGEYLSPTGEGARYIADIVDGVIEGSGTATVISVILLLWTGTTVLATIERAINLAWDIETPRGLVRQRLVALGMLVLIGALLGVSTGFTGAFLAMQRGAVNGIHPEQWSLFWGVLAYLTPLLVTVLTFTLIYRILPNTRVGWGVALVGGGFAGVLWEVAKVGFSFYLAHFGHYEKVYGSIATLMLLLIWINYSSTITVLGAEVASIWDRRHPREANQG